jgi:PAS domain S-box-containing protein
LHSLQRQRHCQTKGVLRIGNDWIAPENILDAMNVGVYVCDRKRKIAYWRKRVEAIADWQPEDVIGHSRRDEILDHIDKDGRPLCGKENCPLNRTMVTGVEASMPIIVFAKGKDGRRIPMQVSVAPLRSPVDIRGLLIRVAPQDAPEEYGGLLRW